MVLSPSSHRCTRVGEWVCLYARGLIVSQFNNNCFCSLSMNSLQRCLPKAISVLLRFCKTWPRLAPEWPQSCCFLLCHMLTNCRVVPSGHWHKTKSSPRRFLSLRFCQKLLGYQPVSVLHLQVTLWTAIHFFFRERFLCSSLQLPWTQLCMLQNGRV